MTHLRYASPWGPAESRIFGRYLSRLLAGRYRHVAAAAADCHAALCRWYAARPGAAKTGRIYPRTVNAVRRRLTTTADARGRRQTHPRWRPVELRLADKWTRHYFRHLQDPVPLDAIDVARCLLADLFVLGYDRALTACQIKVHRLINKPVKDLPRHGMPRPKNPARP